MEPNRLQPHALEYVSEELEVVVQRATQTEAAQIVSWQVVPLTGGRETVSAIYRLDVQVRLPRKHSPIVVPLVLKLVRMTPERRSSDHWNHWLREAEAYASGTLAHLPAGLAAPACYGVHQHGDVSLFGLSMSAVIRHYKVGHLRRTLCDDDVSILRVELATRLAASTAIGWGGGRSASEEQRNPGSKQFAIG